MFWAKKIMFIVLIIGFVGSLWFNFRDYQQHQRTLEWRAFTYNQFIADVVSGGRLLGYHTSWHELNRSALAIGEAAMALNQWSIYCDKTEVHTAPHVKDIANYLSYLALIMVHPDEQFNKNDEMDGEKYIKNITGLLFQELEKNGAIEDIPAQKEDQIFNKMYQLIPVSKAKGGVSPFDHFIHP